MYRIYIYLSVAVMMSSCLTGGFDANPQLEELQEQIARAPKVESITVNGTELKRDQQSRRVVEASMGETLNITATVSSGEGAELTQLEFSRVYYYGESYQEDPRSADPQSSGVYTIDGRTHLFESTYTVPEVDDDGYHFEPGYVILVYIRVKNSLDNFGYRAFEIHIVE